MLQLEEHRQTARQNQTHIVVVGPTSVNQSSPNATAGQRSQTPTYNNYSARGAGSRGRGSTARRRGRSFSGRGGRAHQNWNQGNQRHHQCWNNSQLWNPPHYTFHMDRTNLQITGLITPSGPVQFLNQRHNMG
ncbi:hypothetical protein L1887_06753 [Cichorium endivia]|nr:hypothetical protein L1887_06753 [Cichorium endivia]